MSKDPCHWGGGNDVIWCSTCGAEYAYAKGEQRPACPRATKAAASTAPGNPAQAEPEVILYTNHRGETAVRRIRLDVLAYGNEVLGFGFGSTEWHPGEQLLFCAFDVDKGARRTFAMAGVKAWGRAQVEAALAAETFEGIAAWAEETFGPITPERIVGRADEEMVELRAEPGSVEEAADVVICLARHKGLGAAIDRKMGVNRKRQWRRVGDGTGYHIKAPATPAGA